MWLAARTVGDRARDAERFTVRVHVTLFYSESNGADDEEIRPVRRSALGQDGGDRFTPNILTEDSETHIRQPRASCAGS